MRENIINLNAQLEEAKKIEETLKSQLDDKKDSCHQLELEMVDHKRKIQKSDASPKFMYSSAILDKILENQRSPNDKSGLGYVAHLFRLGGNSMYIKMYIIVPWKNLRIFPLLQGNGPFVKRNVRFPAWEN